MTRREDQSFDELTGNTKVRVLHEQLTHESKRTTRQWWAMFLTPAGLAGLLTIAVKVGACDGHGGWPWPTRAEVSADLEPIRQEVGELRTKVDQLPGDVVKALDARDKHGR